MHKILLSEPRIGSYSALLVLTFLGGYLITRWRAGRSGIRGSHIDNLVLLVAVISLLGARLFSWFFYFPPGISLWQALTNAGGGMVFYGGMIFGLLTVILYAHLTRLALSNLLDVFAPGLALGLALGRVGCFLAGCCWGDLCISPAELSSNSLSSSAWQVRTVPLLSGQSFPFAVRFPPGSGAYQQHSKLGLVDQNATESKPVHPVQLYETVLALALCLVLHRRFDCRRWPGHVFCLLLLNYAVIRFATEFLRGDNRPIYLGLTLSQIISLAMAAFAGLVWVHCRAAASDCQPTEPARPLIPDAPTDVSHVCAAQPKL
jgi:phosphatidylglycerol---prolipoprotein diacylglyceryl transferase